MKRTAQSVRWNNETRSFELAGEITCEVTGEWSNGIKCWTKVGDPCGDQYSMMRVNGRNLFILEATN